jgi:hypothetical protein
MVKGDGSNSTDSSNVTEKNSTATKVEKKPKIEILKEEISKQESILDLQDLSGASLTLAQKR